MRLARSLTGTVLTCVLLFGPERIPLDEAGGQWELQVKLCSSYWQQAVIVQTRTYERTQERDGTYRYRPLGGKGDFTEVQEGWWRDDKTVPIYLTPTPPQDAGTPPAGAGY